MSLSLVKIITTIVKIAISTSSITPTFFVQKVASVNVMI